MADTDKIVEQLSNLSVLEIAGLVKQLEEKWGVSAAAPVAVAAGPGAGASAGAAAPAAEEKTTFDVVLAEMGANKIAVIKEVRSAVPGLGLGVLVRDDTRVIGESHQSFGVDRDAAAAGDVVEHDGQFRRIGNGREVTESPVHRGFRA